MLDSMILEAFSNLNDSVILYASINLNRIGSCKAQLNSCFYCSFSDRKGQPHSLIKNTSLKTRHLKVIM